MQLNFFEIKTKQAKVLLGTFCILQIILFAFSSELFRSSVTHDTLEGIAWGYQWQLGYNKHPFIAAWLSAAATKLAGGYVGLPVYILSQVSIVIVFISNYILAKKIFRSNSLAIISSLILSGIIYHNVNSINYTPDTAQIPFWSLTALFFYFSLKTSKQKFWILTGFFSAICLITKYSAVLLYVPMLIVLITTSIGRNNLKSFGPYIALLIFLAVISPHIYWAFSNGLTGLSYINTSVNTQKPMLFDHIYYPLRYIRGQLGVAIGILILSWPFYRGIFLKLKGKIIKSKGSVKVSNFDRNFVLIMGLGPILLTVLISAFTGQHILQRWSTSYYYMAGIVFVYLFVLYTPISKSQINKFIFTVFIALFLVCITRSFYLQFGPKFTNKARADAYLPNKKIAKTITSIWRDKFNSKLKYIGGSHYLTAYISAYSSDKPVPYMELTKTSSAWVNETEFRENGGIIAYYIKDRKEAEKIFATLKKRYKNIARIGILSFDKNVNIISDPIKLFVAILPPAKYLDKK